MASVCAPGQVDQGIILTGPDSTQLSLETSADNTVLSAKRHWSEVHHAPLEHIQMVRDGKALAEEYVLQPGDQIKVSYNLAGGGDCKCEIKCGVKSHWPEFCACGWCCTHMWIGRCCPMEQWIKGQMSCCYDRLWCMNSDCGFHKIWKCELFCLGCDMGGDKHCCDVHGPKCKNTTDFPSFCRCGLCCSHCWWDRWCCSYWNHLFHDNCCDSEILCCDSNCGFANLGNCEVLCLQGWCFHCGSSSFKHHHKSSGGWVSYSYGGHSSGGGSRTTTTTTTVTTHHTRH